MGNKRHQDNFIKIDDLVEKCRKLIFIIIEFILAILKISSKENCLYRITSTIPIWWMADYFRTTQISHKSLKNYFILQQKESRIYAGSNVSQTPIR